MSQDYKFKGWLGLDKDALDGKLVWSEFEPKGFEETDVDIKVTHCAICGTDVHTLRGGHGEQDYPICVGHEIVGVAIRVGSKVKDVKIGDRVGVGAQSYACLNKKGDCAACADGTEQYCPHLIVTYGAKWPDGHKTSGGYADYWRGDGGFVFKIPDALPSQYAAPMMCGAITAYSPLKQRGAGPGKKVGIIGIGGIGHFGILSAKVLGCETIIAISRTSSKKTDAFKMGATGFIATDEDEGWAEKHAGSLDLILSTVSGSDMPIGKYLQLLRKEGHMAQIGAPEDDMPAFNMFPLLFKGLTFGGSLIGSRQEIKDMLQLYADTGVKPWINEIPMAEANRALVQQVAGKARYRIVLVNEKNL